MGKSQRTKGHSFERKIARELRGAGYDGARRGLQSRDGSTVPDVIATDLDWHIECKCGKQPNMRAAWRQANDGAARENRGLRPLAVVHDDNGETYAVVRWEDFLWLLWMFRQMS